MGSEGNRQGGAATRLLPARGRREGGARGRHLTNHVVPPPPRPRRPVPAQPASAWNVERCHWRLSRGPHARPAGSRRSELRCASFHCPYGCGSRDACVLPLLMPRLPLRPRRTVRLPPHGAARGGRRDRKGSCGPRRPQGCQGLGASWEPPDQDVVSAESWTLATELGHRGHSG